MSNENQEGEVEQNPLHDLVQHSLDQDYKKLHLDSSSFYMPILKVVAD